jgi:hypothetical protein
MMKRLIRFLKTLFWYNREGYEGELVWVPIMWKWAGWAALLSIIFPWGEPPYVTAVIPFIVAFIISLIGMFDAI